MNNRLVIWIIWLGLLLGIGVYTWVGLNVRPETFDHTGDQETIERVLIIASVIQFLFSFLVRGLFITFPGMIGATDFKHRFSGQIVTWAMVDGIAVYGLILYFTGSDLQLFISLLVTGAVGMIIHAPVWTFLSPR